VDSDRAVRRLLERCTLDGDPATLSDDGIQEIENRVEALDPNADLAFSIHCVSCGHLSTAQLDAGMLLWDEIDARARALLGEIHVLAHTYGWSENEILALSAPRRSAYLAMVQA